MSNPYDNARDGKSSVLGPTLKFKGELSADEDLLIQGKVEGTIRHTSTLTIGEGGHVKADVSAEYIAVEGRVEGDLKGSKCVKVRETAKVDGNIQSPSVSLLEGAKFNGQIDMSGEAAAKPAGKPDPVSQQSSEAVTDNKDKPSTSSKKKAAGGSSADAA